VVAAGAVVVIVVVAAIIGFFMMGGSGGGGSGNHTLSDMKAGDYLRYDEVTHGGSTLFETYWINVTAVTATNFTIRLTHIINGILGDESNHSIAKGSVYSVISVFSTAWTDMGPMTLDTALGSRAVEHYQHSSSGIVNDYYLGSSNGILYKKTMTFGSETSEMNLMDSNISWAWS